MFIILEIMLLMGGLIQLEYITTDCLAYSDKINIYCIIMYNGLAIRNFVEFSMTIKFFISENQCICLIKCSIGGLFAAFGC